MHLLEGGGIKIVGARQAEEIPLRCEQTGRGRQRIDVAHCPYSATENQLLEDVLLLPHQPK